MARQKDIDKWYSNFTKEMSARGLDITDPQDVMRFRIPSADKKSSVALFPEGFIDTPKNREKLYDKAKEGEVFFFDKKTQEAYQLGSNSDKDCKVGRANAIGMKPEKPGVIYNLLNLLTLGLVEAFMGEQKEYEKALKQYREANQIPDVSSLVQFFNKITFGLVGHDKCMDYDRAMDRLDLCHDMEPVFRREENEWREKAGTELEERIQKREEKKNEKELEKVNEQVKAMKEMDENFLNAKNGNVKDPEVQGPLDSQIRQAYQAMKDAFAPGGAGLVEAMNQAKVIGIVAKTMRENPSLRKASGMSESTCKRFENLSKSMVDVLENGSVAKMKILNGEYENASPEQKQKYIEDVQALNLLQNTMANSAIAKQNQGKKEPVEKASRLLNEMQKKPEKFQETMKKLVGHLNSTNAMKQMTVAELKEYTGNSAKMVNEIKKDMHEVVEERRERANSQAVNRDMNKDIILESLQNLPNIN